MENHFVKGNSYSLEEIVSKEFVFSRTTMNYVFYRKDKTLLAFSHLKPLEPKLYKLVCILKD